MFTIDIEYDHREGGYLWEVSLHTGGRKFILISSSSGLHRTSHETYEEAQDAGANALAHSLTKLLRDEVGLPLPLANPRIR